jgi:ABC-type lipoprotein export system ATPase subunit
MESFDETDLKFKIPGGMIIAGPSSSGKSTLVMRLLENAEEMFDPPPAEIVYAYGQYHSLVPKLQNSGIRVHPGLPSDDYLCV